MVAESTPKGPGPLRPIFGVRGKLTGLHAGRSKLPGTAGEKGSEENGEILHVIYGYYSV